MVPTDILGVYSNIPSKESLEEVIKKLEKKTSSKISSNDLI